MTPHKAAEPITGAQSIVKTLEALGVDVLFGIPGGMILPTYDPLFASKRLRHILVRHEQGAGHAASGYARATGRVGVCMVTSGPGATNLVTALADATMDSVPVVAITGQVPTTSIGTDAFQESDIVGATMPVTKHSFMVTDADKIPETLAAAFHIASTGRPGAVLVDVPKSSQVAETTFNWPANMDLPGYKPTIRPHAKQVRAAAARLAQARRPVILAGGGTVIAGAGRELTELVELTGIPVVTTLMGLGAVSDLHPQHLGMPGMHGTVAAVAALQRADLIFAIGCRFDDRLTGRLSSFAPHAAIVHADIDPAEIGKNKAVDVPIVGDAKEILKALIEQLTERYASQPQADLTAWWRQINHWRGSYPLGYPEPSDGRLAPQHVIQRIAALAGPDAVFASGVGQHQMWSAQFLTFTQPRQWLNSGGLGTMGYGVPAAMGAKVGRPDAPVWAIDGDGCFQMTGQEIVTCALNSIPIKVAIINNSSLGMVRQWQTLFYGSRYSNTDLHTGSDDQLIPDFVKLAEACGCVGLRCERPEDVDSTIHKANEINDLPVVIDFQVSRDAMVWPMVAAGASNDDIQYARGLAPQWEAE
jgi:acetolactate synthase-1/2/3 large subunit